MFKHTIPSILPLITPSLTWKVKTADKTLFLTFDDGPHPDITPWVLNQLSTYNAKATFFCVGDNVRKFPDVYKQVIDEGHRTGNHTYHHLNGWKTPDDQYFADTELAQQLIGSNLFRPPYGRLTRSQMKTLSKTYRIIMWDILTRDYDKFIDAEAALITIKKYIRNGSVIVFHDSGKAEQNLKIMLPEVLKYYSAKGYVFKSL